jgi:hypothetical protein
MALMFPQRFPTDPAGSSTDEAAAFDALRTQLDEEWYVFYGRELTVGGEQGSFDFLLLHREHGMAVLAIDVADAEIDGPFTIALIRRFLEEQGFPALFAKPPAIVVLGVVPPFDGLRDLLLDRFAAAPHTRPSDPDWVEWLADRLTVAGDLTSETPPLPEPEEVVVEEVQPDFRPVERAVIDMPIAAPPADEESLPYPATMAASDRGLVRALGGLTLFGALIGAVAVAATSFTGPQSAVGAVPPPTVAVNGPPANAPSVAELPAIVPLPAVPEAASPEEAKPEATAKTVAPAPVHKVPRKRIAIRRRHPQKSFWDRVAEVFR